MAIKDTFFGVAQNVKLYFKYGEITWISQAMGPVFRGGDFLKRYHEIDF